MRERRKKSEREGDEQEREGEQEQKERGGRASVMVECDEEGQGREKGRE